MAELWLGLAEEARAGLPSSLFSQAVASGAGARGGDRDRGAPASTGSSSGGFDADSSSGPGAPSDAGGGSAVAPSGPTASGDADSSSESTRQLEVVLAPEGQEADVERLAADRGLEVTATRRADDGSLVATVRAPDAATAERRRELLGQLESAPGVVEAREVASAPDAGGPAAASRTGQLTDADRLVEELIGQIEKSEASTPSGSGFPWRFVLGLLTSVALLAIAAVLVFSAREGA